MTVMILALWGCAPAPRSCVASGPGPGSSWRVTWLADRCDPTVSEALQRRVDAAATALSVWDAGSEIERVRSGGRVTVSEETYGLVRLALDLAAATGGAYDPTVEPLMEAWGLHLADEAPHRPSPEALAAALTRVGHVRVRTGRDDAGRPWVDAGGASLDLESLLEGHVADRLSAELSARGWARHLVDVGGELVASGTGPDGPWRVEAVLGAQSVPLNLSGALATAGSDTFLVDGRPVPTTLDPRTGRPADTDVVAVAVRARDGATADALATAVVALGAERGLALLEARPDVEGLVSVRGQPPIGTTGW